MTQDDLNFSEAAMTQERFLELKTILEGRRREILRETQTRMREIRGGNNAALSEEEKASFDMQDEIEAQMISTKTDVLLQISEALTRLEANQYGYCEGCGEEIAECRLRALPFAIRCKDCEEAREVDRQASLAKQTRGGRNGGLFRGV